MSINIRNNADLEVSTPYFFRNVPIANRRAFGGWNYIAFSEEHFFKTTDLSDSQADRVKIVTGDSRFDIEEGAKSIERVGTPLLPSTEIRYSNNIPSTSLSGFLIASTILSSSVTKRMRHKLSKSGVGLTSGSKIVQMNGTDTSNLGVGMYVQGNGIQNGTKIQSITSTTITLDQNATSTFTTTLRFPVGTLKLSSSHRFNVGDLIQLSEVGTNWDGYYTVVDEAPAGDAAAVRFAWDYDPDSDVELQDASGTVSYNLVNPVSNKQMTNNIATLTISGTNRFIAGDNVNISIGDSWFNGIRNITSKTSSTISFNTEISNWIATTGTASGWTRPSYIDLAANGINNIVYPELPQVYSVTISPTTGLAVGTTLTATESVNSAYRYRSDTITYQWYRSSSLGNQGTLIASGKTYQLTNSDLNQYITAVVTGSNPKGSSTASSAQLLFAGPLPAPTGLSASSITATSATLSWNGVSGASSYEYAWGTSPNPTTWSSSGITSSNNVFSVSISGMVSNTTYYFRVRGKKNSTDVDGTISSINFNTRLAAPTVSASRNLASNSYTSASGPYTATTTQTDEFGRILISTTALAGGRAATPQFYKIQSFYTSWADVGVFSYNNSTTTGVNFTTNTYLIPRASLTTGGREYQFRVAICDSSGNTLLSDWSSSTPNVRPFNAPSAPELISIETGANATQGIFLKITWNSNIASDEPVYGWAVTRLSDEGDLPPKDVRNWVHYIDSAGPSKATQDNHTFENLSANTSYTFRVKALVGYTSSGSSSNLNVVNAFSTNILKGTATTATTPGQPTSLSASPNKSGSYPNGIPTINVSWAPPTNNGGDAIESYLYRIGTANPPTGATWFSTGNSNTTLTISTNSAGNNLQLNTLYYIQIRSTNGVGSSPVDTAPVISARTWNVPSPPSTLSYSNATATGVTISWTTPSNNGGTPIIGYGLQRNQSPTEGPSYSVPDASVPPWIANWSSSLSGTWFWFRVKSYNDLGISTSFASINPPTVPSQPGAPTNARTNSTTNTVSWTAPSSNG